MANFNTSYYAKLKIYIEDDNLKNFYKSKIDKHNENVKNNRYPDSGFDLFVPDYCEIQGRTSSDGDGYSTNKIDMKVKCSMTMNTSNNIVHPVGYYLYPRSSISKTPLRLANSVGIIDSGYRGSIMTVFDNVSFNLYSIEKHTRLAQICSPDLRPIIVILVDELEELGLSERGQGGFGSTGV